MTDNEPQKMQFTDGHRQTEELIYVCDECLMASCWAGKFMCERAGSAGLLIIPKERARALDKEHPTYLDLPEVRANPEDKVTPRWADDGGAA